MQKTNIKLTIDNSDKSINIPIIYFKNNTTSSNSDVLMCVDALNEQTIEISAFYMPIEICCHSNSIQFENITCFKCVFDKDILYKLSNSTNIHINEYFHGMLNINGKLEYFYKSEYTLETYIRKKDYMYNNLVRKYYEN